MTSQIEDVRFGSGAVAIPLRETSGSERISVAVENRQASKL
jgi:hypothetical protein